MTLEEYKKALLLSGRLAIASGLVISASAKNISQRIETLEIRLAEYDNFYKSNKSITGGGEMNRPIDYFANRLDEIFEQGNPTKAMIIDAFHKANEQSSPVKEIDKPKELTDEEIINWFKRDYKGEHGYLHILKAFQTYLLNQQYEQKKEEFKGVGFEFDEK